MFEEIRKIDENGMEYWSARELAKVLTYADYRNFLIVIGKAKESCRNSNQLEADHFVDVNEMVQIGSGAKRQLDTIKLSRYACYQNRSIMPSSRTTAIKGCTADWEQKRFIRKRA